MSKVLTFAVILAFGWLVLSALQVFDTMSAIELTDRVIGQGGVSGVVGLLVMAVLAGLVIVLYSELGEADPMPDAFPPERPRE